MIRILQREERLSLIFLQEQGLQYLCQKLHEITSSTQKQDQKTADQPGGHKRLAS